MTASSAIENSAALIVAAGAGKRMGSATRKQYLSLAGEPVLAHTLRAFDACSAISAITLVAPPQELEWVTDHILRPLQISSPVTLCAGGRERQDSVRRGLSATDCRHPLVAIHDGVRPLIRPDLIEACLSAAAGHGAALLAVPVADTLKQSRRDQTVRKTQPRDNIWLAQTPQAFDQALIREAHRRAADAAVQDTDDAALVERMGRPVRLVLGSRRNIKVTTPEDLLLAEAFLAAAP
ncbi:MAG: 2-C-methyl-D-erythritol 4-phosphate cytidylyltransferase [Desulfosarcinaceae bacterium]|nr:2-C-methyl-D-erythritol 4-phosphate cytidylyltransferase [Desulfosarcinaceae bacterium]